MARGIPELETAVSAAVEPTWSEVVRAKRAIQEILADGEAHGVRVLQRCLIAADGISPEPLRDEKLQLSSAADIERVVTASEPLIARPRLALAATEAIVDLVAQGIVVGVEKAPAHADGNPIVKADSINIRYQFANQGSGIRVPVAIPELARGYRLAPRLRGAAQWFLDPDLFTADLGQLQLDQRARRCIVEALAAYRRGLFLACASLLGAASEGAWYAAGEQLRHLDPQLARALDGENTARVMSRVAELLRQQSALRTTADELYAQAALLRHLRNYGAHPRSEESDHLERYFTDSGAAILLMETYTYLNRLATAVATRLGEGEDSPNE